MEDSSGGSPGPAGIKNLKELLQKTKDKFETTHPEDKRWPCPFCLNKERHVPNVTYTYYER